MKRNQIIGYSLFLIVFWACQKHTCECSASLGGKSQFIIKGTKNKAKTECKNYSSGPDINGNLNTCDLK